jgi:predicted transposase YdaD
VAKVTKPYDNGMRRLMAICAQDFLDWLEPGTFFTGKLSEMFESISIEADAIHETIQCEQLALYHFEFQSGRDSNMERRLLEYLILAYRRYNCPVSSYVIYLKPCSDVPVPPLVLTSPDGKHILTLDYEVIVLPEIPYETLLAKDLQGLLPLVPLAAGGAKREVIEEVIKRLAPAHDTIAKEVLALTQLFASLAFDKNDVENQVWIIRRFAMYQDILSDTPAYQYLANMFREEALKEGREEGRKEERKALLKAVQEILLNVVQAHFPPLTDLARTQLEHIEDVVVLSDLAKRVSSAHTQEEAQHALLTWKQTQSD